MSLNSDLASLQTSRMDSLLRFVRTFRKTLFNKKSGIQYAVNECCRDWWAEARNCRVLSGKPLPQVPSSPEEYGNPHYVEARVDELEIWLEQSIKALKLDAEKTEAEVLRSKLIAWSESTHRCRDRNSRLKWLWRLPPTHFRTGKLPTPRGELGGIAPEITGDNGPPPPEV